MEFWQIPGPRRFFERISDAVLDGRIVFVHIPNNAPSGLIAAILTQLGYCDQVGEIQGPIREYLEAQVPDEMKARARRVDLDFLSARLAGRMYWLEASQVDSARRLRDELTKFGEIARAKVHGEYPSFIVLLMGEAAAERPTGAQTVVADVCWDGYVEPVDMLMYATYSVDGRKEWKRRLFARIASEVACYDPMVVDLLCELPEEQVCRPEGALQALGRTRGWDLPAKWGDGSSAEVNGVEVVHSGHPSCTAIAHRVWRAQIAELFPVLEMRRFEIVELFAPYLCVPDAAERTFVNTLQDLEFTDVIRQLSALPFGSVVERTEIATLKKWRDIRNKLAHGEVVDLAYLDDSLFRPLRSLPFGSA
jgi:hypothetical protein